MAPDLRRLESTILTAVHRNRVTFLQAALGVVFLWFGFLKLIGRSPVEDLVLATVPLVEGAWFIIFLGVWEMVIGALVLWGRLVRTMLVLFTFQMAGTFLVLVVHPGLAFQSFNPLLLTVEGEFVVKNLVLLGAGFSVAGHLLGGGGADLAERAKAAKPA